MDRQIWKKGLGYQAIIFVEKMTYFFAKHVIVTNESYKEIAQKRGKKEDHITVVRSGPDLSK